MLPLALLLAAAPGFAEQVFSAQRIVEVEAPANAKGIPDWKARRVSQVIFPVGGDAKGLKLPMPVLPKDCATHGTVRYLVLFKGRAVLPFAQQTGRGTSAEGSYAQVIEALTLAGAEQLWADERAALASDNPFSRTLAAHFLTKHGAAEVVDAAWGAPGSEQRKAAEVDSELPPTACSP